MQANFDWIWWIAGGALALLGLVLLYRSLFHDRARGRRRCPKCWYDLSGTPGNLVCSECGHRAKRESKLFKTRRRWRWALIGLMFATVAYPMARAPSIRRDGAMGWCPTSVLILAVIWFDSPDSSADPRLYEVVMNVLCDRRIDTQGTQLPSPPELWDWQWRLLINHAMDREETRYFGAMPGSILETALCRGVAQRLGVLERMAPYFAILQQVRAPNFWPVNVSLPFAVSFESPTKCLSYGVEVREAGKTEQLRWSVAPTPVKWLHLPNADFYGTIELPPWEEREFEIEITIIPQVVSLSGMPAPQNLKEFQHRQLCRVRVGGLPEEWIRSYDDPALEQQLREGFELKFRSPSTIEVYLGGTLDELQPAGDIVGIKLLRNEELQFVGSSELDVRLKKREETDYRLCAVFDLTEPSSPLQIDSKSIPDGDWRFRFYFDRDVMLMKDPKRIQTCWPGVIEGTLDWASLFKGESIYDSQASDE